MKKCVNRVEFGVLGCPTTNGDTIDSMNSAAILPMPEKKNYRPGSERARPCFSWQQ